MIDRTEYIRGPPKFTLDRSCDPLILECTCDYHKNVHKTAYARFAKWFPPCFCFPLNLLIGIKEIIPKLIVTAVDNRIAGLVPINRTIAETQDILKILGY